MSFIKIIDVRVVWRTEELHTLAMAKRVMQLTTMSLLWAEMEVKNGPRIESMHA